VTLDNAAPAADSGIASMSGLTEWSRRKSRRRTDLARTPNGDTITILERRALRLPSVWTG